MKTSNNMRSGKKKGLSPVIASVLMIMLVLVLAAMIFLWARGFISEQIEKFGKPIDDLCDSVDFQVERIGNKLEILNQGNVDIWHLDIKKTNGGDSEVEKFDLRVNAGEAEEEEDFPFMMGENNDIEPDEIVVYPALLGNVRGKTKNKAYTCTENGKTI